MGKDSPVGTTIVAGVRSAARKKKRKVMPRTEEHESIEGSTVSVASADLLITVSGPPTQEWERWAALIDTVVSDQTANYAAVAIPADGARSNPAASISQTKVPTYTYQATQADNTPGLPGIVRNSIYRPLAELASKLEARALLILAPDSDALDASMVRILADAVLNGGNDLSLPIYATPPLDGLLNRAVFSPLVSVLYGRRVRFPLAQDFCISARMLERLAALPLAAQGDISWPSIEAVASGFAICEAHVNVSHHANSDGLDLSGVLNVLLGSLYSDMEKRAALWQRPRGLQPLRLIGWPATAPNSDHNIDIAPLRDAFLLGFTNLQEVWSLVLPPVTLMDLKRLSKLPIEQFHMPDTLWTRIIYDFALAHRLRTISRAHLLGALVPLYLGWVASYVRGSTSGANGQPLQDLEKVFEENKAYFVSRWRWPDRFNP
jgi:glucosylglycerate synthase